MNTYECGFRLRMEEGAKPIAIKAQSPHSAAEKFADYAHARLSAWELGDYWEGEDSVGVRLAGTDHFTWFEIERRVVPEFTARLEPLKLAATTPRSAE